jgi:hypothetical protein
MQPLGRYKTKFPNKTDCHCKKDGLVNWWETGTPNKIKEKQRVKNIIKEEIIEMKNESK